MRRQIHHSPVPINHLTVSNGRPPDPPNRNPPRAPPSDPTFAARWRAFVSLLNECLRQPTSAAPPRVTGPMAPTPYEYILGQLAPLRSSARIGVANRFDALTPPDDPDVDSLETPLDSGSGQCPRPDRKASNRRRRRRAVPPPKTSPRKAAKRTKPDSAAPYQQVPSGSGPNPSPIASLQGSALTPQRAPASDQHQMQAALGSVDQLEAGPQAGPAARPEPSQAAMSHPNARTPAARILKVPSYTPLALGAAARHEFIADGDAAGIILLKALCTADALSAVALWDTGAEDEFISWLFVERHNLQSKLLPSNHRVKYADGSVRPARGELLLPLRILTKGKPFERTVRFIVADLQPRFDIVLGIPFCKAHRPRPDWERMTISLPVPRSNGTIAWQPALRVSALSARGGVPEDASNLSLCELSLETMEKLRSTGMLDSETISLINIRPDRPDPPESGANEPALDPESKRCEELRQEMFTLFAKVFPDKLPPVTDTSTTPGGIVHRIQLKEGQTEPYSRPLRRMSTQELDELKKQLQEYLESGRLRPSESPWGTNVIFAKKKDGNLRFCVDYRGLNDATIRNSYPLPHTDDLFDRLQGAMYYSKIDLRTGFYQILLAEGDREKTAFRTRYGHFEWTVLPMGLTNAPATFQHLMNHTFRDMLDRCVLVFLDDIVVYSRTLEDHERDVRAVLTRLLEAGLYAKKSKCELFKREIEFLGHHVGREGLRVMEDKVRSVQSWPTPRNASELRSFLGLAGYYRRFVAGFSGRAAPLHDLTHTADGKRFEWQPKHQTAFDNLKQALATAPVLSLPDPDRQYVVNTDASDFAVGAVLQQDFGRGLQPIAFTSHKLTDTERRYPTHDREMLAIIYMLGEWRTYLQGRQPFVIRIRTDHNSLQYFMTQQSLTARQSRWLDKLADYDFKIEYIKGPSNTVADALSRRIDHSPEAGSLAALTLATLASVGTATLTKAELLSLPMFSGPRPETLLATARLIASCRASFLTKGDQQAAANLRSIDQSQAGPHSASAASSGHCPDATATYCAALQAGRTRTPLTDEQRAAHIFEATKSHPPAIDRPAPDAHGVIRMPSQQCTAYTAKGAPCKLRTLRGHQCAVHTRIHQRLAVSRSTTPGAGLGLYVAKGSKPIRRNERIALYSGDWVELLPDDDSTGGPYFLQLTRRLGIDAARTNTALGRWANDPRGNAAGLRANARLVIDTRNRQGALKASRTIYPGQEIFCSYGRGYWKVHGAARPESTIASALRPELIPDQAADLTSQLQAAAAVDQAYQAILTSGELGTLIARDGLLYDNDRVVVPNDIALRTRLLSEAHDSSTAGHSGIAATKDRLTARVTWAGIASDIHDYVVSCDSCQRNKVEQRRTAGLLRPPPVPDEPGHSVNIDFVFGLPKTTRGHTGYMSITCRLSNWLQPALCSDSITAEGAAQLFFDRWVCTFGLPARIMSDRDPRFTGRFWRELWRLLDTRLDMSTAGHPQTDGKAENRQRTANTMLRHYVDFEQADWDMKLLHAAHAINHTKSVSSGLTPFEVMFRRSPRLPLDIALDPPQPNSAAASRLPAVNNFLDRHRYIWSKARENMLKAQSDQKTHADKHRREESFVVGDSVLLSTRDLRLASDSSSVQRANKLTARFVGPFKVTRVINPNAYELELPSQLRIHPVQNISKLRRYVPSPDRFSSRPVQPTRPPPDCIDPAGDEVYLVERLLAARQVGRRKEYLVKWEGYPLEESSWEPKSSLRCPDKLAEFEANQLGDIGLASAVYAITTSAPSTKQSSVRSPV